MLTQDRPLSGRTALVTGAAKRIGRSIAVALARERVRVVVHHNASRSEAAALAEELRALGVEAWSLQADMKDPAAAGDLLSRAVALAGPMDILINNAAIFPKDTVHDMRRESLLENIQVNAFAPFQIARAFAGQDRESSVVNLLDARMLDNDAAHASYHLSKRMLFSLTRMMALEFAPKVRVNAVAPGLILPPPGEDDSCLRKMASTNPLNRWGSPEQVADAVCFLLRSDFVTGQVIYVDGGRHMLGCTYG